MSIIDLPDGLHPHVKHAVYHERVQGLASKSALDLVGRSAAHYKRWLDGAEDKPTPALILGSALHCAALEPERFAREYAIQPDFGDCRFKEAKAERDRWRAANDGKTPLDTADGAAIAGMIASIRNHPKAGPLLTSGTPELTMLWTDPETGLRCKGRADFFAPQFRTAIDIKTTEDARPPAFAKSVANYGYHRQAAFYSNGFEAVGAPIDLFVFVAVEKVEPYLVKVHTLDGDALALGEASIRRDLLAMRSCIESREFVGYDPEINIISLPPWAA